MSNLDIFKKQFQKWFDEFQNPTSEILKQVFQQENDVKIENSISDNQNLTETLNGLEFPMLLIPFKTKSEANNQHIVLLNSNSVTQLYGWMIGADPSENMSEEHVEGLLEAANQIFGNLTSISDQAISVNEVQTLLINNKDEITIPIPEDNGISISYTVSFGEIDISLHHITWETEDDETDSNESDLVDEVLGADESESDPINVSPVEFGDFDSSSPNGQTRNIDMLLDVELEIRVELGKKAMKIQDVLKLGKGSVIELEKNAGEPLEVYINDRKLAEGEVVVVDDHFGIRITQLVSPKDRIKSLG